jgi:hypothetical protein
MQAGIDLPPVGGTSDVPSRMEVQVKWVLVPRTGHQSASMGIERDARQFASPDPRPGMSARRRNQAKR